MFNFSIEYFTARRRGRMDFAAAEHRDLVDFFGLFGTFEEGRITMEPVQRASAELKANVATFCDARKAQVPQMGAFRKLVEDLTPDEAFVILPAAARSSAEVSIIEMLVAWANGDLTGEEAADQQRFFAPVFAEYELVNPATDRPNTIGNVQKERRVCRFCDGTKAKGATFKSNAHAISFGLGNVHLKLADECDVCNGFFGRELEPHLLALLDIQQVFLGTRGRGADGGLPHVKLRGGSMRHDSERIVIEVQADQVDRDGDALSFELENEVAVIPERCYRTLAKFALSVIPEGELDRLQATVRWVRDGERPNGRALPPVYTNVVALEPNPSAQLALYVRRAGESDLPHVVCEFRLGCFVYVFVLPFSDADQGQPAFFGSERFAAVFPHYAGVQGWRGMNLENVEPIEAPAIFRLAPGGGRIITLPEQRSER